MDPRRAQSLLALGYALVDELGRGGMGKVWRARDLKLDREVAIKFIAAAAVDEIALRRFHVEARALARIKHPNVVVVYQLGDLDGVPFLVYELVDGVSVEALMSQPGELSWTRALTIIGDLARGLAAAHLAGVLHRDLKPANAVVTSKGVAKLIDFGLAKLGGAETETETETETGEALHLHAAAELLDEDSAAPTRHDGGDPNATATHGLLGTPRYLAPELWRGQAASPATDVYTLGLIAWELLTGRRAHANLDGEALVQAIIDAPLARVRELRPELPADLAAIVDRAVDKSAAARFASAEELSLGLAAVIERLRQAELVVQAPMVHGLGPSELAPPQTRWTHADELGLAPPQTRWIRAGELSLAIQQFGSGPVDLIFIPAWVSHCEVAWRLPAYAKFMASLGRLARVTVFDKRGTGMSDRMNEPAPIEERMLDIAAILDALELDSAVLFGVQDGGVLASAFTAAQPERVRGLIWYAANHRLLASADNPTGMPASMFEDICAAVLEHWGAPLFADFAAPSRVDDPVFLDWWSDYLRNGASPSAAKWMLELNATIDIAPLLPAIGAPTLLLHRRGDRMMPLPGGQIVAQNIAGARWIELDGDDHQPWFGDTAALLEPVATFLDQLDELPRQPRRLVSLLARGDELDFCAGPVHAIRRALSEAREGPALVHVGSTDHEPGAHATSLLARLGALPKTSVVATRSAAYLAGGAGLSFVPIEVDGAQEELFLVVGPQSPSGTG